MSFLRKLFFKKNKKRKRLLNDEQLKLETKNNDFRRKEELKEALHVIYIKSLYVIPRIFLLLLILDIWSPAFISNKILLDKIVWSLGVGILGFVTAKYQKFV